MVLRLLLVLALLFGMVPPVASPDVADARVGSAGSSRASRMPLVAIQPLGGVRREAVLAAARAVESAFAVRVVVLPTRPLPAAAFYRPRARYRGEKVLADLDAHTPARYTKVIGLMARDLSVTKGQTYDWGVIGVAGLSRRAGVVSVYRLGGRHATPDRVIQRLCRVTVHELAHAFGARHCRTPGCIMNDARGTVASVDRSSGRFCARCKARLAGRLRT